MIKKSLILFLIFACLFFAFKTNAQVQSGDIVLSINPSYPKANEEVTASVSTYTIDLSNARISWVLNGSTALEGMGKKSFSFKVGDSGFETTLEVKIETINGSTINKKITISPSDIDLLWEANNSYVPPFYKGKTLLATEGKVKVVAIPSTQNLAGFNYKWKQDNKNQQDSSGYEKNYYTYRNSFLEDNNTVEVAVSDLFGNNIGINKISIIPGIPKIIFYGKDQNLGIKWENAIGDGFTINRDGDTLVAEPYFFSSEDLNSGNLTFDWSLNGEKTLIPNLKNTFSLKPEDNKSGNAIIKIVINNTKTLFQSMSKEINVNF
jgi:hypothetical protein